MATISSTTYINAGTAVNNALAPAPAANFRGFPRIAIHGPMDMIADMLPLSNVLTLAQVDHLCATRTMTAVVSAHDKHVLAINELRTRMVTTGLHWHEIEDYQRRLGLANAEDVFRYIN